MDLAIIGCGHWGIRWIKIFESVGAKVKVCCDIDETALRMAGQLAPHAILTTDYEDILDSKKFEAVYVAAPPSAHYEVARKCLLANKHVHVEKPMVTNYEHGLELIKLAEKRGRILMVGNTYLYNKAIQKIKTLLTGGLIGRLRYVHLWMTDSVDMWIGKDIRNYDDVVWDLSPHPISIANYIIEEWPYRVFVPGYDSLSQIGNIDAVSANLYFSSGANVTLYLNWLDYERNRRILILGDKGAVQCGDFSDKDLVTVHMRRFNFSDGRVKLEETKSFKIDVSDTLLNEAKHFIYCVSNSSTPISDGFNGVGIVAVIEAIHRSIVQNKPCQIVLPQDKHRVL